MKRLSPHLLAASLLLSSNAFALDAPCETGIFRQDQVSFVALTQADKGFDYTFDDGRVGNTQDATAPLVCTPGAVLVSGASWPKVRVSETDTHFDSHGVVLAGRLLEAPGAGKHTPLVVFAHGSEENGWIGTARDPYQLLGRGVSAFVYDKRGTGRSKGKYTQNFPLLADDLVAASREAKRLAGARYGRFGLVGLSQGGWIVPLAAARARADFVGIGFGLAVDIAEEDAEQVAKELRERGYGDEIIAKAASLTAITARIVKSGYRDGLDELAAAQLQYGKEAWYAAIRGAYTGVYLGTPVDSVRKNGVPQLDKLGVDWTQDPMRNLRTLKVPQRWALAAEDRQAPIAQTVERLAQLRKEGQDIALHVFPETEHGMWNYEQAADLSRKHTGIAPGFYTLMADWALDKRGGNYGKALRK
jgi:hypothetical protein